MKLLCTCTPQFEHFLARELADNGSITDVDSMYNGWLLAGPIKDISNTDLLCFPRKILFDIKKLPFLSITNSAQSLCDFYSNSIKGTKVDSPWTVYFESLDSELVSTETINTLRGQFLSKFKKVVSRIVKLAVTPNHLSTGSHNGLFVFVEKTTMFVSTQCWSGGQQRMKLVNGAPSRSFLKVEEAFKIMNRHPDQNEIVVDLGAAPGGWSFAASLHNAKVYAVDNGPLKEGALNNAAIKHFREDAFTFDSPQNAPVDWLLCDMVEDPSRVVELIRKWMKSGWCKKGIINFKFGHTDPLRVLALIRSKDGLLPYCKSFTTRHLYHDREEFTVMFECYS